VEILVSRLTDAHARKDSVQRIVLPLAVVYGKAQHREVLERMMARKRAAGIQAGPFYRRQLRKVPHEDDV
jgi:hypothetical protein